MIQDWSDKAQEVVTDRIAEMDDAAFDAFILGIRAASSAAVYSKGTLRSEVAWDIQYLETEVRAIRDRLT